MEKARRVTTVEQLYTVDGVGPCELVRGQLVRMPPAGGEHGRVAFNLARELGVHVKARGLGTVYAAETGFVLGRNPDTVRAPDVAFIRAERRGETATARFIPGAPDLAVEVLSTHDTHRSLAAKAADWLAAGARLLWVVDPEARTVTVHRPGAEPLVLGEDERLDGDDVVPGFRLPVADIFA